MVDTLELILAFNLPISGILFFFYIFQTRQAILPIMDIFLSKCGENKLFFAPPERHLGTPTVGLPGHSFPTRDCISVLVGKIVPRVTHRSALW